MFPASTRRVDSARRLRDLLRTVIRNGAFGDGVLPLEHEFVRELQVTRNTLREALHLLHVEGIVDRKRGDGTHVVAGRATHRIDRMHGFEQSQPRGPERTSYVVVGLSVLSGKQIAGDLLQLGDADVVMIERVSLLDGFPISLRTHWLASSLFPDLEQVNLTKGFYELVEEDLAIEIVEAQMHIDAVPADERTATLLDVPVGAPLLLIENLATRHDGTPVALSYARCRPDRMGLATVSRRAQARRPADESS